MCDTVMPAIYKVTVLHPQTDPGWVGIMPDVSFTAASLTALVAALLIMLMASRLAIEAKEILNSGRGWMKAASISMMILCAVAASSGIAFGESNSLEILVLGPPDSFLETTVKEISQYYSDANNVPVNITLVRGREMVQKEVMKNESKADVVILEKEYPLFNLSGMERLHKKGMVENYSYLYSENALMIVRKDEHISALADLNGLRVAVTDQHVPGACLAKKIIDREGLNATEVKVSSNEAQLDAVVTGAADATVLWERMFEGYKNSTSPAISFLDLPMYRMDNYIAVLNTSGNRAQAEMYVDYLIKSLVGSVHESQAALKAAA